MRQASRRSESPRARSSSAWSRWSAVPAVVPGHRFIGMEQRLPRPAPPGKRRSGPAPAEWAGLAMAMVGLAFLTVPGKRAPDLQGSLLMGVAGVSWGIYSLRGREQKHPLPATAGNFVRAVPVAACLVLIGLR